VGQVVVRFDIKRLENYMQQVCDLGLNERWFVLVGVGPLVSARTGTWMRDNVPGVHIPDAIIKRLLGADNQKEEGTEVCIEVIQRIREIDGVHVMAYRQEKSVPEIINASGVLGRRPPWFPSAAGP
jgi:methylenetetrahydrofolate reductase (NADPH)